MGHKVCNITVTKVTDQRAKVDCNFHYGFREPVPMGEIDLAFEKEWEENQELVTIVLGEIFK